MEFNARAKVRRDAGMASQLIWEAVDLLASGCGGSFAASSNLVNRYWRDVRVASLHGVLCTTTSFELYGRLLSGRSRIRRWCSPASAAGLYDTLMNDLAQWQSRAGVLIGANRERGARSMKSEIIERLGQTDILLPALIAEGLAANDRVKTRLSVLQAALRHARDPGQAPFDMADECRLVGLDPVPLQGLVDHASLAAGDEVTAPGLRDLIAAIWGDLEGMIRAVKAGDATVGDAADKRLADIQKEASLGVADAIAQAQIACLTAIAEHGANSLHRLVMDLHKALNRLSSDHAEEVLAGAHVYGLMPEDRPAVEAFMRGVEATGKLKFGHPGLATTAARSGTRLTIQNDIGETDAHVVVIAVEADAVTVTYTDVHLARAKFFTGLLQDFSVQWSGLDRKSAKGLGDDGVFYLATGRCTADVQRRNGFLEAIGASLVFLIDWNKARKVLQTWISKTDAVRVLDWAARSRFGHRAFLELGGSDLVAAAVHHAVPTRIGFGERLDRALGREAAAAFLKTVLRISAEALLEGSSVRLVRDRIEADLVRRLQRVDSTLLAVVTRQAGLAREIAEDLAQFVSEQQAHRMLAPAAFWQSAPGTSRKKLTGLPSRRAARSRAWWWTIVSRGWSTAPKRRSTSWSRRHSSPRWCKRK